MKRFFSIILINLIIIVVVLSSFEYLSYKRYENIYAERYSSRNELQKNEIGSKGNYPYNTHIQLFDYNSCVANFRKPLGENYKKRSIVLFGCSFAYGDGLLDTQNLSYKLYKITKRPVYNRAFSGWGPQHMLYQLKRTDFYNQIGSPKNFIYVYMFDHQRRLLQPQWYFTSGETYLRYKEKNGKLEEIKPFLYQIWGLYSIRFLQELYEQYITLSPLNEDKRLNLLKLTLIESNNLTKKAYPDSKFIVIKYQDNKVVSEKENEAWDKLKDSGITVINVEELLKDNPREHKYKIQDGHPNEKVWNIIVPELAKRLTD